MQGIVFNPHYMMYFDVAFTEYWRMLDLPYPAAFLADGSDTFMVASAVNYRDAARFDDEIDIGVRTAYFGTTSFRMAFEIRRGGGLLVDGNATYVVGDSTTRAPRALPAKLLDAVAAYEAVAPERKPAGESGSRLD